MVPRTKHQETAHPDSLARPFQAWLANQTTIHLVFEPNSTIIMTGSEGTSQASLVCQNIKFLAQQKQPGAQAASDDMSQRVPAPAA